MYGRAALIGLCLFCCVSRASAGDAAAEALFRAGREAAEQKDYETACARFEESNRLEPAAGTVFNLAHCREQLGELASAWQRYLEVKDKLEPGDSRLSVVSERIANLEKRLPKLILETDRATPDLIVLRDGKEVGAATFGLALPVDPGRHTIVVRAPGRKDNVLSVELGEGEQRSLKLEPGVPVDAVKPTQESAPSAALTAKSGKATSSTRTAGFVVGGIGAAGLVTSLITGAVVLSKKSTVDDECSNKVCSPEGVQAGEDGALFSTVSTVAFAVGAVGLGVGTYLVLSSDDSGEEQSRLGVEARPGQASLTLGGRF
jgi:hypothetical protein